MITKRIILAISFASLIALSGCSRRQSDWQKTRETNTTDSYEQFLKKYPSGEFTAQAQARVKELYEERDWQKARDTDTPDAYQAFLKEYPEGKWTEEARIRVENFALAQAPSGSAAAPGAPELADNGAASSAAASNGASVPSSPAPTAAPSSPAGAAAAPASGGKSASASGAYGVQLGAYKAGADAANRRWAHLKQEYPALFSGVTSKVVPKKTASGDIYRLQATGLSEKRARAICASLKAKSQACLLVLPNNS